MSEKKIMQDIQVELSRLGARVFRNNIGLFETSDGRKIRTGLCVGSSDLIGWCSITVTQDMIGRQVAIFTAVEVKTETGRVTPEQENFIGAVRKSGGIAFIARSINDAVVNFKGQSNGKPA